MAEELVPWSDLRPELLELIMARVNTAFDLLRCRGVCHSWRSAALNVLSCAAATTTIPSLLLYTKRDLYNAPAKLLYLGKNTTEEYRISLPKMKRLSYEDGVLFNMTHPELIESIRRDGMEDDKDIEEEEVADSGGGSGCACAVPKRTRCVASYRGWLLLYPFYERALYLFNPLSRMVVHLPPPPKVEMVMVPRRLGFITSSILTDPNCMVYLLTACEIAVYKLADRKWSPVFTCSNYLWVCVISYRGNFYSADKFGVLRRLSLDESCSNYKVEEVCNGIGASTSYRYLVESWSGELLMVVRSFEIYERSVDRMSNRTKLFQIFKLNWSSGEWEQVNNFGDRALFLARNDSKFVSVRYKSEYEPNSIYFIGDNNTPAKDFGVYDLTNMKIELLNPSDHIPHYASYSWFQPVL